MTRHQTTGPNRNIKEANESFENVDKLKYLETAVTNENCFHEGLKSRFNLVNGCHRAVQNILSCRLLPKNVERLKNTEV